ncbi:hypothetical protein LRS73_21870 [Methylobacterium currus]|uniref:hypothetical protein n=1 Tax=Methylobacterium currus TaxID=2051553 RepID=UPI001E3CCCD8|nr:hypothetical protein [Methylobacterium currus]UHC15151.1 hypothetical protein LRS73_21870 [Methylobacterium currus]
MAQQSYKARLGPPPMSADDAACRACCGQMRAHWQERPHARLMVVASTPVIEAFGGGVETRYLCLECGHTLLHSTGRFGQGWH